MQKSSILDPHLGSEYTSANIFAAMWSCAWKITLREKCPYSEFSWSVFSNIQTEYGKKLRILRISPYSVRLRENTDQKNSEYGHFSWSVTFSEKI